MFDRNKAIEVGQLRELRLVVALLDKCSNYEQLLKARETLELRLCNTEHGY